MPPQGLNIPGVDLKEITGIENAEYTERYFNVEDWHDYAPKILKLIESKNENNLISFFQQVRKSKNHDWTWYLSTVKIFHADEKGAPTHIIVIACPIDSQNAINAQSRQVVGGKYLSAEQSQFIFKFDRSEKGDIKTYGNRAAIV